MKSIVIWYSLTGNVTYAAQKIAEILQADTLQLKPVVPYPEKGIMKWLQ
ncbi:MAG: flavodoxin, partial [Erysipelotrichaceae bacterium]|nr:flavodoxin [Erysipelotrichaceae bacterium]